MKNFVPYLLAAVLGLAPLSASAQTSPLAPGMELTGTMDQTINSSSVHAGDQFVISNVTSGDRGIVSNATIYGHVAEVTGSGPPGARAPRLRPRQTLRRQAIHAQCASASHQGRYEEQRRTRR